MDKHDVIMWQKHSLDIDDRYMDIPNTICFIFFMVNIF